MRVVGSKSIHISRVKKKDKMLTKELATMLLDVTEELAAKKYWHQSRG
jgi:hypothetical protein